ncbi:MAG TPA: PIG-L family deacetylase [Chryseosolibacter sp.]
MKKVFWALLLAPFFTVAQTSQPSASQIKLKLKKLNFLGSVLYVAAHPDDENTRVITYLSNEKLASTAYLSLTRGDGGQNLIGSEIGELLGLIRTQELLAARRIDGGQQFFSRAIDFGFSKSADEAFQVWGKENVLSDVVKVFRKFQPDVIITRFPPDERAGHGHHTASAVLAGEAFDVAAKEDAFPDQVKEFGAWQPKRLYTNTGRWWNQSINENTEGVITMDVGAYNALLGKSYPEISALSSSQHKSQGWGRRGERGYLPEYFEFMKGKRASKDMFDEIDTSWGRVKGGEKIKPLVDKAIQNFVMENPSAIIPDLLAIRKEIAALPDGVWKSRKLEETEGLIQDCLGLFIEVTASHFQSSPGEKVKPSIEIINRSGQEVKLIDIKAPLLQWDTAYKATLPNYKTALVKTTQMLSHAATYSGPYWLNEDHEVGLFNVKDKNQIGLPENLPAIEFIFNVTVNGQAIALKRPLVYKWVDPVKGELSRPFEIVPPVFINPLDKVMIFSSSEPRTLSVVIKSTVDRVAEGKLKLKLPEGWRSEPQFIDIKLNKRDDEELKSFTVFPSANAFEGSITPYIDMDGKSFDRSIRLIAYDHIPTQTLMSRSTIQVAKLDLKKEGTLVAYINGAGDDVPAALRNMGYEVWEMKDEEVTPANLKKVDAVVLGIRALNTNKRIKFYMDDLLNYVNEGGTMVVQYNVNGQELGKEQFAPFPIKISRDRVTEENAQVRLLKPDHPVLNTPNKLSAKDFEGWVQERGLYFPNEWDSAYEPILSMNDKNETPKNGSLLVAKYGKGYYVYTGLSFFRQLPDGVPGAYKLFANLVSLGKASKPDAVKAKNKAK